MPWDDIAGGTPRDILWKSFRSAMEGEPSSSAVPRSAVSERPLAPPLPRVPARRVENRQLDRVSATGLVREETSAAQLAFWVWLEPDDAWRPDVTLARGLLSALFDGWQEGVAAYLGGPELIRPERTSGLARLQARFKPGCRPVVMAGVGTDAVRRVLDGSLDASGIASADLVYRIECGTEGPRVPDVRNALKVRRVPFQTVRGGQGLWSVVARSHRRGSGVLAACETADPIRSFLIARAKTAGPVGDQLARLISGGIVRAVYALTGTKCTACGAPALALLRRADPAAGDSLCVDCFT